MSEPLNPQMAEHQVQIVSEYHCPTCAALGYLGTHIDRLEAGLREGLKELDTWLPSESSQRLRGILADALGEP